MDQPSRCVLHGVFFRAGYLGNKYVRHTATSTVTRLLMTADDCSSANSLSAANDMTVLLPRYINIRRGQVICAFLGGWALCPWEILARHVHCLHLSHLSRVCSTSGTTLSVQGFLTFMSGYTVFLGPFAGIMIADYYIVHRCKVDVPAMYDPHGRYRYTSGIVSLFPTIN